MIFQFGEWYGSSDTENYQVSDYEVFSLPLSYLYIMMFAISQDKLVPVPSSIGSMANVIEDIMINKELEAVKEEKNVVPVSDLTLARQELENIIESLHRCILKYDDVLTKEESGHEKI